jgi:hypothetical protein
MPTRLYALVHHCSCAVVREGRQMAGSGILDAFDPRKTAARVLSSGLRCGAVRA